MEKEIICGIYKITSPTNRIYIGESSNIEERWKPYKALRCKPQRKLYYSLNKYGVENHTFEIIEECEFDDLKRRERFWQEYYKSVENGLNCNYVKTDEKKQVMSEETKQLMRESRIGDKNPMYGKTGELHHMFGTKQTYTQKKRFSKIMKGRFVGEKSYMFGVPKSQEIKDKGSKSKLGKKTGFESPVAKLTIKTDNLKIYPSAVEAFKDSGMDDYDYFKAKLNGARKNDTYFMYLENYEVYGANEPEAVIPDKTVVRDTLTLIKYDSIADGARATGVTPQNLARYLSGERPNTTYFVYEKDYVEGVVHYPLVSRPVRKVIDNTTGTIYDSVKESCEMTGVKLNTMKGYLAGNKQTKTNFSYYEEE